MGVVVGFEDEMDDMLILNLLLLLLWLQGKNGCRESVEVVVVCVENLFNVDFWKMVMDMLW